MSSLIDVKQEQAAPINSLMSIDNYNHWLGVATGMSKSTMVPKNYIGKPMDIFIAMEMGFQLGMSPLQSLQDIAVINGKPCVYGDGMLAVVQGHQDYEWIKEDFLIEGGKVTAAICIVKRRNHEPHEVSFTVEDAKKAALWGKQGPWSQYPNRMLQMRARAFALRNTFADALRGIKSAEEVNDMRDITEESNALMNKSAKSRLSNLLTDDKEIHHEVNPKPVIDVTNQAIETQTKQDPNMLNMVEDGKQAPDAVDSEGENKPASPYKIEEIEVLLYDKMFAPERLKSALEHYKVSAIRQLTEEQADHFIKILNKEESKR